MYVAVYFQIMTLGKTKIIYMESICRVETLSMSGKILYHIADHMLVQWQSLLTKYPKCQYIGRVV
jgi:beta-1,4-N-acetylglucosaminyltransferase